MPVTLSEAPFGSVGDSHVSLFTFANAGGVTVSLTNFGCTLTAVVVPSKAHGATDVVLAYDSLAAIQGGLRNFGSIVGRYANRICAGKFSLDGVEHSLECNNGPNHLHGGPSGFYSRVFDKVSTSVTAECATLVLRYDSADGEEGYPGRLSVTATFSLDSANRFHMQFKATTDKATIVNLCNHAYWNLAGHDAPAPASLLAHTLALGASHYTPNDDNMIPLGHLQPVRDTPFDFFHAERAIGERIAQLRDDAKSGGGYDLNFAIDRRDAAHADAAAAAAATLQFAARLTDPRSGRSMLVETNAPGVQLYTGNWLATVGKGGARYEKFGGACLETQHFPNSPNTPAFPSPVLRPGETYCHDVRHTFSW